MNILKRFSHYLFPYWFHIVLSVLSTMLFVAFSATAYWLAASFLQVLFTGSVDEVALQPDISSLNDFLKYWTAKLIYSDSNSAALTRAAAAIAIAFLGKNLFSYLQLFFISFVEQKVIKDLRDQLFMHQLRQDLAFFHEKKRGHLISSMLSDVETLNQAINKSFTKAIRDPLNILVLLVLLFTVAPRLTLFAFLIIPAVGWTILVLGRKIKIYATRVQEAIAEVTGHLQETISGIRVVKSFAAESFENKRFFSITQAHYRNSFAKEKFRRLVIPLNEFVGVVIISGLLYLGGELVLVKQSMNSEDFIRFLVLLFALLNPILSLTNFAANVRVAEAAGSRVFTLMDRVPNLKIAEVPVVPGKFTQDINIEDVTFGYSDDQKVLENISLKVSAGENIAIVGRSGSGKSTLVNLLPRFYDPVTGMISIDGCDLKDLDLKELRKLFGIVTQNVILFHDTVAANIAYSENGIDLSKVETAAKAAYAHDFISGLPEGYDTIVGEQGALLSGGQRQRISIARALLRNPPITILDEATSALDPESADEVAKALDFLSEGRTVIMVTHRLASVIDADRIVVLDEGRLAGIGTHSELLKTCEIYHTLAEQQRLV
ncbi:MAG: ABC transporter ATP-binding protein [Candidatus Electryonea clarkiae]|nr:ABC transporter ATP-binding protein [Candidatus Electryonea clarkiae]MDP8288955.1 ABC transporter ATP-binding protein [Candidatus Electryonea clarkiae]